MRILVIGQTSLHWGRMEYGNIGNYYIIEPFFRELHRIFLQPEIFTTLQMSDEFCIREKIARLPLELYYSWDDDTYLQKTIYELGLASVYQCTKKINYSTPFITEVLKSDLVIDFSGDIWGNNANLVGKDRFLIGLMKNRIAQLLGVKNVMLAGSPGPFDEEYIDFAKEVFKNFDLVTNREEISTYLLEKAGFDTSKVINTACPAFLFEPESLDKLRHLNAYKLLRDDSNLKIGFTVCGWNLIEGPFNKPKIREDELIIFAEAIEFLVEKQNTSVYLISHSTGFDLFPYFNLKEGRDFMILEQLFELIKKRNNINADRVILLRNIFLPKQMKAIIGMFDFMISGRIHAAVAALSQNIPTVIIDYGHEPKAHKLKGFAQVVKNSEYIVSPDSKHDLILGIKKCWDNKDAIKKHLDKIIPEVKDIAKKNFDLLKNLI